MKTKQRKSYLPQFGTRFLSGVINPLCIALKLFSFMNLLYCVLQICVGRQQILSQACSVKEQPTLLHDEFDGDPLQFADRLPTFD